MLTLTEDLSEAQRIKVLLNKKDPLQQGYVFINAINIFKGDPDIQREIIPLILEKIKTCNEEVQAEAGSTFFELIRQNVSSLLL